MTAERLLEISDQVWNLESNDDTMTLPGIEVAQLLQWRFDEGRRQKVVETALASLSSLQPDDYILLPDGTRHSVTLEDGDDLPWLNIGWESVHLNDVMPMLRLAIMSGAQVIKAAKEGS